MKKSDVAKTHKIELNKGTAELQFKLHKENTAYFSTFFNNEADIGSTTFKIAEIFGNDKYPSFRQFKHQHRMVTKNNEVHV
jgi:hypothetical protein